VTNPSLLHFSISKLAPHSIQLCYFCMASGSQSQLVFVQCQVSDKCVFIYQSKMCVIVSPLCIARPLRMLKRARVRMWNIYHHI